VSIKRGPGAFYIRSSTARMRVDVDTCRVLLAESNARGGSLVTQIWTAQSPSSSSIGDPLAVVTSVVAVSGENNNVSSEQRE
jgi:hypothetical protein